jgi:hypothetical protein
MPSVKLADLLHGFEFASVEGAFDCAAYISLDTAEVHLSSSDLELEEGVPQGMDSSDRYLAIPNKHALDLGRALALAFAREHLRADYEIVFGYFKKRGAYAHFKRLLQSRNALERWYEYERAETETALRAWCATHGIQVLS